MIKWHRRYKEGNAVILREVFTCYCVLTDELARQTRRVIPFQKMRTAKMREHEKKYAVQDKAGNLKCFNYKGQRNRRAAAHDVKNKREATEMPRYG